MLFVANDGRQVQNYGLLMELQQAHIYWKDIWPGSSGSTPQDFFVMGDVVYFRANDGTNGYELWRTDGTATGTVLVNDILLGSSGSTPWDFIQVGDDLYFSAASSSRMRDSSKSIMQRMELLVHRLRGQFHQVCLAA